VTEFGSAVEIAAPPERVWAVMSEIERWAEWTPSVTRVERLDPGPLAVGHRARIRQPRLLPAVWRVTAIEPGRGFTWVTRSAGLRATGGHRVEPAGSGSRAELTLRFEGPLAGLVARLFGALTTRYLALEAGGLKERSEGRSKPE
jgi:carbon monoxide dehydrogenase subunit G